MFVIVLIDEILIYSRNRKIMPIFSEYPSKLSRTKSYLSSFQSVNFGLNLWYS